MSELPLDALAKWSDGKSLGVSLSAITGFATTRKIREFLEKRRTRWGRFAINPSGDDAEWFSFYRSQKRFEKRVAAATLGEIADLLSELMNALRNPRAAASETKILVLGEILACFMKPSGPDRAKVLEFAFGDEDDEPSDEKQSEDPALLFCYWVLVPCWLVYGLTPMQLMRRVSKHDELADKAVERIVRLDHRAVSHPVIRRWLLFDPKLAPFKQAKLDKWRARSPFDKEKSESLALRQIAGLNAVLSELFDDPLDVNDQRRLIETLGPAIPDDLQAYVLGQTNDDLSRGIRRQKAHFQLPPKPDKSAYESVRALLDRLQ